MTITLTAEELDALVQKVQERSRPDVEVTEKNLRRLMEAIRDPFELGLKNVTFQSAAKSICDSSSQGKVNWRELL